MSLVSEDIRDLLLASDCTLDLKFGTNLFVGFEPSEPDNCVTIYDSAVVPTTEFNADDVYYYGSFQVRVRNRKYIDGMNIATAVMEFLHNRGHEPMGGGHYELIQCTSGPALLGVDEQGRFIFVVNFSYQRRRM
jgi:hypothetical protein